MKFKGLLFAGFGVLAITSSCIKHEIIPAPEPRVELICSFTGKIETYNAELTQNVQGYYLETNKSKIVPPTGMSEAVYYSHIKSNEQPVSVKINIGKMKWDGSASSDPNITTFNNFFANNTQPVYTNGAVLGPNNEAGIEIEYRDGQGNIWKTKDSDASNTFEFKNVVQESDKTGDYSKFVALFNCKVYHTFVEIVQNPAPQPPDTIYNEQSFTITDGVFKGWFKR